MEWMFLPLKRYADFSGRSRRMEYWMFALLNLIIGGVLLMLILGSGVPLAALDDPSQAAGMFSSGLMIVFLVLAAIWALGVFIPSIAVTIRRLHDRDMSGWWYLGAIVASFIPFVGFIANIALLVLMCLPGTPGPNRFGPDPKDPSQASVFS